MRGFVRISAAVPATDVADFQRNANNTLALWRQAHENESALVVFPELGLTGYSTRDLLHDTHLLDAAENSLLELAYEGREFSPVAIVGLPVRWRTGIYNAAAAIHGGRILGIVPKAYLPNYREFEEARWFRPGVEVPEDETIRLGGEDVPFGMDILLAADNQRDFVVGIEICEDYWVQVPPSTFQVGAGATVIANLSASNFIVGKAELRRTLARPPPTAENARTFTLPLGPVNPALTLRLMRTRRLSKTVVSLPRANDSNVKTNSSASMSTSKRLSTTAWSPTHSATVRESTNVITVVSRLARQHAEQTCSATSPHTRSSQLIRALWQRGLGKSLKSRSTHSPHDSRRPV